MNERSYSRSLKISRFWVNFICILLCILSIIPFWIMFVNATRDSVSIQQSISLIPSKYFFENAKTLLDRSSFDLPRGLWNSFSIAASSTALAIYFSCLAAFGLIMYDFKLKKAAFTFILAVLMIPAQVSVVGFIAFLMQVNLMDTYVPLIIPSIASPAVVFFMHQYMKVALPVDLVQAARIEGCGEFRIFNSIAIPIMVPAMATQAIFSFVFSWNNLFMPTMIINSQEKFTIPMMVQILKSDRYRTDFGTVYLGITLTILPMMVIYAFLSKYIIQGIALGGVKY